MTVGQALGWVWRLALAWVVLKSLADILHSSHIAFAVFGVILPIGVMTFIRFHSLARKDGQGAGERAERSAAALRQLSEPDQIRIASLAESGKAIEAIKAVRGLANVGLLTAKDVVDQLTASLR